ncbi:hypothetical protein ACZ87_02339 [Candidatus Erwinia dacicola]|uniref:Uncharacterized protein n=1 Tax=Candidatus Erwinia dacicola TaxID=252393 RepID=A0A328TST0_9GAMM|nr:hypothetical protein ACZ87_02339 [Candidatus Erwinia dacicola]
MNINAVTSVTTVTTKNTHKHIKSGEMTSFSGWRGFRLAARQLYGTDR